MNFIEQIKLEYQLVKESVIIEDKGLIYSGLQFEYNCKAIYFVTPKSSFICQDNGTTFSIKVYDSDGVHIYIPLLYYQYSKETWVTSAIFTREVIQKRIKEMFIANCLQHQWGHLRGWIESPEDFIWVENTLMANLTSTKNGMKEKDGSVILVSAPEMSWVFPLSFDYHSPYNFNILSVEKRMNLDKVTDKLQNQHSTRNKGRLI